MTKTKINTVIKRYNFIAKAIKRGETKVKIFVGNRREVIEIDEEVKAIAEIVEEIERTEQATFVKFIISRLKRGCSDIEIIQKSPGGKNWYYSIKHNFIEKIYRLCIRRGLVTDEEIMNEAIKK